MNVSLSTECTGSTDESSETGVLDADSRPLCLDLADISKKFTGSSKQVLALDDVDLSVYENEFFCLLGPSGCGKTTLLRIVSGLVDDYEGTVEVRTASGEAQTNMVFQESGIFPWKTVIENVAFGLKVRGIQQPERRAVAREYLEKVDLEEFADAYPHQLSGGMKQRVGIARAFVNDPDVLLMDEPFGTLDAQTKRFLQDELIALWNESKKTVIYVTHDIDEAIRLGDRIGVMSARPGRLQEIIDVDIDRPRIRGRVPKSRMADYRERVWELISAEVERSMGDTYSHGDES